LGVRPGGLMRVRPEPETGPDTLVSCSCTSAGLSVHRSGSRRNPLRGSRVGVGRHGPGGHD
jgi:hypothetical protein